MLQSPMHPPPPFSTYEPSPPLFTSCHREASLCVDPAQAALQRPGEGLVELGLGVINLMSAMSVVALALTS